VGRHRPSFFYLCDYKGYKDAVDSGDYTGMYVSVYQRISVKAGMEGMEGMPRAVMVTAWEVYSHPL
jgi:hypothetical protein